MEHESAETDAAELRQAILMAAVLDDVDVTPAETGVVLSGAPDIFIEWSSIAVAVHGHSPTSPAARALLVRWLTLVRRVSDLPLGTLHDRLRPVGLPPGHLLHPGAEWVCVAVPGGALDLGLGLVGVDPHDPDGVVVAPRGLLEATGIEPQQQWSMASEYLERMGHMAALRLQRDRSAVLRPMGDCDVLTLLGSTTLRTELAMADGVGMRGIAVPMRTRGWTDPDHVDSAFAMAAATATDDEHRGLWGAVLVTPQGVHHSIGRHVASDFTLREVRESRPRHRRIDTGLRDVRYRST